MKSPVRPRRCLRLHTFWWQLTPRKSDGKHKIIIKPQNNKSEHIKAVSWHRLWGVSCPRISPHIRHKKVRWSYQVTRTCHTETRSKNRSHARGWHYSVSLIIRNKNTDCVSNTRDLMNHENKTKHLRLRLSFKVRSELWDRFLKPERWKKSTWT